MATGESERDGSPPGPQRRAVSAGDLVRVVRRSGNGAAVQLPRELLDAAALAVGVAVRCSITERGTVELVPLHLVDVGARDQQPARARVEALAVENRRLRRQLVGRIRAAHAQGVCDGYMLGLRDAWRDQHQLAAPDDVRRSEREPAAPAPLS